MTILAQIIIAKHKNAAAPQNRKCRVRRNDSPPHMSSITSKLSVRTPSPHIDASAPLGVISWQQLPHGCEQLITQHFLFA